MYLSDFKINPAILEARINAVMKNEFPFFFESKVKITCIDMQDTMSGPKWDSESKDVVGVPVKKVDLTIHYQLEIRTDFEYERIIERGKID